MNVDKNWPVPSAGERHEQFKFTAWIERFLGYCVVEGKF